MILINIIYIFKPPNHMIIKEASSCEVNIDEKYGNQLYTALQTQSSGFSNNESIFSSASNYFVIVLNKKHLYTFHTLFIIKQKIEVAIQKLINE